MLSLFLIFFLPFVYYCCSNAEFDEFKNVKTFDLVCVHDYLGLSNIFSFIGLIMRFGCVAFILDNNISNTTKG